MRMIAASALFAALAAPAPALAQDRTEDDAARMADMLRDPVLQQSVAQGMAAASEALLDVPLAPLARAVAEAAGDDPRDVDPDLTLRHVSPGAEDVPSEIHDKLPRAMDAVAGMAGGMSAMIPALREMAERVQDAVDQAGIR